jgi:GNAT superfamily N-acetyltransferase
MIKVLSERLYLILGKDNDLGNKLHSYFIYECDRDKQIELKKRMDELIGDYSDMGLLELAYDAVTRKLIQDLIALRDEPQWLEVVIKLLRGLSDLLDREIKKATEVHKPEMIVEEITERLRGIQIYDESDIVDVQEEGAGMVKVNYVSRRYSPEYDGEFKAWRDTQFIFTLNFNKNLFIWDYINIYHSLRGKGMGSGLIRFCEGLAKDLGFERFSVEYPNRRFWERMGYQIPNKYKIGEAEKQNYTHEGYKEFFGHQV